MVTLQTDDDKRDTDVVEAQNPGPYAEGSPEESFLRNHLSYLTHGPGGVPTFVWRMILGILLNFMLLGLLLQFVGRPLGWAYGYFFTNLQLRSVDASIAIPSWAVWSAVLLGCLAVLVGWIAVGFRRLNTERQRTTLLVVSGILIAAAVAFVVFVIALPELLVFVRGSVARLGGSTHETVQANASVNRSASRLAGVAGGSAAVSVATILTALRAKPEVRTELQQVESAARRRFGSWLAKHRGFVLNLVAAVSVPVGLIAGFTLFVELGAANTVGVPPHGHWWKEFLAWLIPAIALVLLARYSNVNSTSMHSFYKRALCRAFAVRRICKDGCTIAEERPYDKLYPLSISQPSELPQLLICSAVNLSDYGLTPTGKKVASFVFSADRVGSTNCDAVGEMKTTTYEDRIGKGMRPDLTLPAAVSISGAAISPEMGKMTRAPLRALLALGNVRLGVWVPNPKHVENLKVLKSRHLFPYAPRMQYLIREIFGYDHAASRFLYVTDGGHYENLGLVELLRKRCTQIICIDASGEKINSFGTIFDAMRLANSELQVDFSTVDPTAMGPAKKDPALVRASHLWGKFTYDDGTPGEIVIVKAGVPTDAPPDLLDYRRANPTFPYDTTLDQFFDADRFDAYRRLGAFCTDKALGTAGNDPADDKATRIDAPVPSGSLRNGQPIDAVASSRDGEMAAPV